MINQYSPFEEKFKRCVKVGDCLEWPSKSPRNRYRTVVIDGKIKYIHRHVYELKYGKIPKGMIVHHQCHNMTCVNVDHLQLLTNEENAKDQIHGKYLVLWPSSIGN